MSAKTTSLSRDVTGASAPRPAAPPGGFLPLELPGALLWHAPATLPEPTLAPALAGPGVHRLRPGLLAVLPVPGDPAVFDVAAAIGRQLVAAAAGGTERRLLIFLGTARWGDGGPAALPDPLLEAIDQREPRLAAGSVHLTARATQALEAPFRLAPCGTYESPGGHVFPLLRLGASRDDVPPFRNPEVLGRRMRWVLREHEQKDLSEALAGAQVTRLTGPLGAGKSRLAWEVLRPREASVLWTRVGSHRSGDPGIAEQLMSRLGPGDASREGRTLAELLAAATGPGPDPPLIVVDGLESASARDWDLVRQLLGEAGSGRGRRLLLIGRTGSRWPAETRRTPILHLPPLDGAAEERVAQQLFASLSVPPAVEQRLRDAAAGNPLALEEGVVQLAPARQLRRVYGSFFFSGDPAAGYLPSPRWTRHLEAEVARLGDPLPLRLQAACEDRIPPDDLAAAAARLGAATAPGWQASFLATGWLRTADGPWGEGVELPTGAHRAAVAATLAPASRRLAREVVGERMAAAGGTAEARWHAYRLLAGTPAAARLLRSVATSPHAEVPRRDLLDALRAEVAELAAHPEEEELEFDLLWALLPLARRVGRLHELEEELDRAIALSLARGDTDRFLALATLRAELAQNAGRFREAESLLRQALAAASGRDDRRKGLLVTELGKVLLRQARYAEARELLERALGAFTQAKRLGLAATCQFLLGNVAVQEHRLGDAERLHREALLARREGGVPAATAASLSALGALKLALGDYPRALSYYREAEEILAEHGKDGEESFALIGLGRSLGRLGDYAGATAWLRRALALREGRDDRLGEAIARLAVAENLLELGQPETALSEARRAHFDLSLLPEGEARADAEHLLGRILLSLRRLPEAERCLAEAERIHRESGKAALAARDLARRLEVALAAADVEAIRRLSGLLTGRLAALGEAPPADEPFDYHLYRAAVWLRQRSLEAADPRVHLERAHDELLRQTAFLEPTQRSRFLFQIRLHREILDAATHAGLPLLGGPTGA